MIQPATARPARTSWRERPWVGPFALIAVVFVAYSLPPYLSFNPAASRVPPPDLPGYFPLLVAHVLCGSVAILTCCLQVWPRFRTRHSVAHRRIGRVYVFAGVLPAGLIGLVIGAATPFGPVAAASNVLLSALWLTCTAAGWRAARARRFGEHRRWMVRSFALTASIVTNRLWAPVLALGLGPSMTAETLAGMTTWLGWTIPLLVAQWWLDRKRPLTAG